MFSSRRTNDPKSTIHNPKSKSAERITRARDARRAVRLLIFDSPYGVSGGAAARGFHASARGGAAPVRTTGGVGSIRLSACVFDCETRGRARFDGAQFITAARAPQG